MIIFYALKLKLKDFAGPSKKWLPPWLPPAAWSPPTPHRQNEGGRQDNSSSRVRGGFII